MWSTFNAYYLHGSMSIEFDIFSAGLCEDDLHHHRIDDMKIWQFILDHTMHSSGPCGDISRLLYFCSCAFCRIHLHIVRIWSENYWTIENCFFFFVNYLYCEWIRLRRMYSILKCTAQYLCILSAIFRIIKWNSSRKSRRKRRGR